jgi:hypothetical protein
METLNNAARAAGFAMATSDDLLNNSKAEPKAEIDAWRPGEAIMASQVAPLPSNALHTVTDWVKGRVLSMFGRGAPA